MAKKSTKKPTKKPTTPSHENPKTHVHMYVDVRLRMLNKTPICPDSDIAFRNCVGEHIERSVTPLHYSGSGAGAGWADVSFYIPKKKVQAAVKLGKALCKAAKMTCKFRSQDLANFNKLTKL